MFWNECRKILFCKKTVLLFLLLCTVNGMLLVTGADTGMWGASPEDYRNLYREMEGMEPDAAYAWITEQWKSGQKYDYFLCETAAAEMRSAAGYDEFREGIAESAERLEEVAIFRKKSAYAKRSIRKMAGQYENMPPVAIETAPSKGVVLAASHKGTDLLAVFFAVWIVFSVVAREKELGQLLLTKTTRFGHARHGAVKLAVSLCAAAAGVAAFETVNLILAARLYGLGNPGRAVQSVCEYRGCILPVSAGEFLLLVTGIKILSACAIAAAAFWTASVSRSYFGMAVRFLSVFAAEGICFLFIPKNSIFGLLRYLNLFAGTEADGMAGDCIHLNFFGQPIWYLPAALCAFCLTGICASVFGIRAYAGQPPLAASRRQFAGRFRIFPEKTVSLFWHEAYKLLVGEKVLLILAAAAVFFVYAYHPMRERFEESGDMYFKQYMLQLEGLYEPGKDAEIEAEQAAYDAATREMLAALEKNPDAAVAIASKYGMETEKYKVLDRVREHARYLEEHHGAFVYDTGYRILAGDTVGARENRKLAVWVNLLLVLCTGFLFSADAQSGVDRLQRAAWRGRRALILRKVLVGTCVLLVVYAMVYAPFVYNVLHTYGTRGIGYPACSLRCLSGVDPGISIGGYLAGLFVQRYVLLWGKMNVLFFLAARLRSNTYTVAAGIGLYVGPLLLYYF